MLLQRKSSFPEGEFKHLGNDSEAAVTKLNWKTLSNNNNGDAFDSLLLLLKQDQDGEIPMSERSPDAQDHGIPINDETGPYEEVSNLPHSVYAKLDRNRRVEKTSDSTYQKLLKPCSEYAIPANVDESSYEFVPDSSPSVYAELKRNPENTSDNTYQKLLKPASDYVIPAENDLYEEVGKKKSPPEYTELDQTKREDADASYQKLLKK